MWVNLCWGKMRNDHSITPFEAYCLFQALKLHFTTSTYDFFKYHGKTHFAQDPLAFDTRKDKYYYVRLVRKYNREDLQEYFIANILEGRKWIGDFEEYYFLEYRKRNQAFTHTFQKKVDALFSKGNPFSMVDGQYPPIIWARMSREIPPETFSVLCHFFGLVELYDQKIGKDDIIWIGVRDQATKLLPFLEYDKEKIKEVLKEITKK